jgi:hypothetical protein
LLTVEEFAALITCLSVVDVLGYEFAAQDQRCENRVRGLRTGQRVLLSRRDSCESPFL